MFCHIIILPQTLMFKYNNIRYIHHIDDELTGIRENSLTFVPVNCVIILVLENVIPSTLKELGLDLKILRGQCYDGTGTMSGNFQVVQA